MNGLNNSIAVLGGALLVLSASVGWAAPTTVVKADDRRPGFGLAIGTERMDGDTTYRIGFPLVDARGVRYEGHFPISELEFPLDVWLFRVDGTLNINEQWRANLTIKKNLSTPDDPMIDSDWLTLGNPGRLDVYSEMDVSSFDGLIVDADVQWSFLRSPSGSLFVGAGILYQKFEYDTVLLYQYSPSGLPGFNYVGDGRTTILYDITYTMPYLKIGGDLRLGEGFTVSGSFAYSPFVQAEDTDYHLLREFGGKKSTGDMDGTAYLVDITGRYLFASGVFLQAGFQYCAIEADGDQTQEYHMIGVPLGTIKQEVESRQTSGYLSIGYRF